MHRLSGERKKEIMHRNYQNVHKIELKRKSENVIIYTNMTRSMRWRRIWIKMLLFFLRTSMKQFCFSLGLRNAMNSTLQNRDIRDNQWNASLFLCRLTSFQSVLTASVYLLHFTLRRLQLNRFRPARRLPPGRLTPHSVKQLHSLSTALRVLFPPFPFQTFR